MTGTAPFEGLRVLELSDGIAGAWAGKLLADAGAEVIRLEPPGGDPMRRWKASAALGLSPPLEQGRTSPLFHYLNGHKRSRVLDLQAASAGATAELEALAAAADILLVDLQQPAPSTQALLQALQRGQPGLTVVEVSAWGGSGPFAGRSANDFSLQAEIGATAYRGYADRPPIAAGGQIGDYLTGSHAAVAAVAGWLRARQSGRGPQVAVPAFEVMLMCLQPYQYLFAQCQPGVLLQRSLEVPSIEPASDGWVGFCAVTAQQWQALAELVGHHAMGKDPGLAYSDQRCQRLDEVQPKIHAWTRRHSVEDIVTQASAARIPVAPVGNGETVTEMAQMQARGIYRRHPDGFLQPRPPFHLGHGGLREVGVAPALDEYRETPAPRQRPDPKPDPASALPLAGLTVVDFTAFWAGPYGSACLAALGADVIKIESTRRPDGMRFASGMPPGDKPLWETSPISHGANSNKRDITLDLESEAGLDLARRLIARADIVIENFSPRVMERFGLGWEQIHALNPEAIMVRMPAFGLEGPWRDRTGFAATIEQVSGLAWLTGYPDRAPLIPRGAVDPLGGITAVFATLAALEQRRQGLGGQLVEVPLMEPGLAIAAEQVLEFSAFGVRLERMANRSPRAVPQGVFNCAGEGMLALSVSHPAHWQALVDALGLDALRDPALQDAAARRQREDEIEEQLALYCQNEDAEALAERLALAGVPAAPLRNVRETHRHPQLQASGFFTRLEHAVMGELDYPAFPFTFDGQHLPVRSPAPLLGEHNRAVLQGLLGLSDTELAKLEADGVIGNRPAFG